MTAPREDYDDVLPQQQGVTPLRAEIAERYEAERRAAGRRLRLRSWTTVLVGLLVLLACFWLSGHTR